MKQYNTRYNADARTTTADAQYDKRGSDNSRAEELLSLEAELIAAGETREYTASYVIFDRQKAYGIPLGICSYVYLELLHDDSDFDNMAKIIPQLRVRRA